MPLTSKNTVTSVSGAWNTVTMVGADRIHLTAGTKYWIVFEIQATSGVDYGGNGGARYYKSPWTYGTAFPNPWSGGSTDGNYEALVYWTYFPGVSISDSGSGVEALTSEASFGIADSGSGADNPTERMDYLDNAIGGESPIIPSLQVSDQGTGAEGTGLEVALSVGDAGSGADDPVEWMYFNDQSYRHNAPSGEQMVFDAGLGTESFIIEAAFNVTDVGSGVDVFTTQYAFGVSDSGLGGDASFVTPGSFDFGSGSEAIVTQASLIINDLGVGLEIFSKEFEVLESGQGTSRFAIRVLRSGRLQYTVRLRVTENVFDPAAFDPYSFE